MAAVVRRRRIVLISAVAVVVAGALAAGTVGYLHRDRASAASGKPSVVTVARGTVAVTLAAAGTVQSSDTRGLSFAISGTVTSLAVKPGDKVTAGQVLARIDDSTANDAVSTAQSSVTSAEQALADAQAAASSTTSTGCQAPAAYQVAAAQPSTSPAAPQSASPSPSPGRSGAPGGTTPSRPAASASHQSSGSGCGTGNNAGGSGGRTGGGTDAVYSATQQLNNAKLALTKAQANLAGTVITAPIAGRVLTVDGTVGAAESPGSTAFLTVGSIQDTEVQAEFTESDVASLKVGQPATISLASSTDTLTGKVSRIDPAGTVSGRLVRYGVMIAFDNPPDGVLYGQSANVVVTTASVADVLYVSSSAVAVGSGDQGSVTVRTSTGDVSRTVQIGLRGDQYTEIRSGLAVGDQVVIPRGGNG